MNNRTTPPYATPTVHPLRSISEVHVSHDAAEREGKPSLPSVWTLASVVSLPQPDQRGHHILVVSDGTAAIPCFSTRSAKNVYPPDLAIGDRLVIHGSVNRRQSGEARRLVVLETTRVGIAGSQSPDNTQVFEPPFPDWSVNRPTLDATPNRLGIVTSLSSKALGDITHTLSSRSPWTEVVISPAKLRGPAAAEKISAAVRRLEAAACDAILITCGGGSREELAILSDGRVLQAILESKIPILTAIGHAADRVVADHIAARSYATPTTAAVELSLDRGMVESRIAEFERRVSRLTKRGADGVFQVANPPSISCSTDSSSVSIPNCTTMISEAMQRVAAIVESQEAIAVPDPVILSDANLHLVLLRLLVAHVHPPIVIEENGEYGPLPKST